MATLQWIIAAITSIFVATVGYLQWRTAQQKAVLDLFDRRFKVYETVKNCVDRVSINSALFGGELEKEFLKAVNEAYFLFRDDVHNYLETLRKDIVAVRDIDRIGPSTNAVKREQAMNRINKFYEEGQPRFAKYMRFSQTVPANFGSRLWGLWLALGRGKRS